MRLTLEIFVVALAVFVVAVPNPHTAVRNTGITIPLNSSTRLVDAGGAANLDAFDSHLAFINAKIRRGVENYEKNTGLRHPASVDGVEKRQNVPLFRDRLGTETWCGTIMVGNPPKAFTVAFDTGFSDVILSRSDLFATRTPWNPYDSSTSQFTGGSYDISVLRVSEEVIVYTYTDTVLFGGLAANEQTIGLTFLLPRELDPDSFEADGVLGMGFQSISTIGASPVFQTLVTQQLVNNPVFSFKLSPTGAELYIGGVNSDLYTGDFTYVPVMVQGHWQVNMDKVQANNVMICTDVPAIIDTGSSLITGPRQQVDKLFQATGGVKIKYGEYAGKLIFPCDAFPGVTLTFGGTPFLIPPSDLNVGPLQPGWDDCISGINYSAYGSPLWVIGNRFLRNIYTTFDVGGPRVGFAQLA